MNSASKADIYKRNPKGFRRLLKAAVGGSSFDYRIKGKQTGGANLN
jgi:hypothetical protein